MVMKYITVYTLLYPVTRCPFQISNKGEPIQFLLLHFHFIATYLQVH